MQHLVARVDGQGADELARLVRDVIARRTQVHAGGPAAAYAVPTSCALCDQRLPERVILMERGTPRHVDARAYISACERVFGAPLCATHLRAFDPYNASILDGLVIGHTRGGLVVDVAGQEGFVPRRYSIALRSPFLSDADTEALLVQQRGRAIRLQSVDHGNGRRPVYREVHPDESLVLDMDRGPRCRAIRFPVETSVGTIHVQSSRPSTLSESNDRRPAVGVLIVPSGSFVWLEVDAPAALGALAGLEASDLQGLVLDGDDVADTILDHISHLDGLEHIVLRSTSITDEGVGRLMATYPCLRALEVLEARHVTGTALASAAVSPSLEHLSLAGTPLGDAGAAGLVRWHGLHSLDLRDTALTDATLHVLKQLTNLEGVDLSNTAVGDEGLAGVAALEQLAVLQLSGTRVTDAALVHVARLPRLAFLGLARTRVSVGGVLHLAGVPTLQRLDLSGTDVSGADVLRCAGFESLTVLSAADVTWTNVPAVRDAWRREQAETRRLAELRAAAEVDSTRERRRMVLDALGLVFIIALFGVVALQAVLSSAGGLGDLVTWAIVAVPPAVAWCLSATRPSYREAFWVGGLLGGLVVAVGSIGLWHGPPLESIDRNGSAAVVLAIAAFGLALGWPIWLARPGRREVAIFCVLAAAAVFVASPVHSSADEALAGFWRQYGLNGVAKLVLISLWLWVTFTATRLLLARLSRRPTIGG